MTKSPRISKPVHKIRMAFRRYDQQHRESPRYMTTNEYIKHYHERNNYMDLEIRKL